MKIFFPTEGDKEEEYRLVGTPVDCQSMIANSTRSFLAAAHVVADPLSSADPGSACMLDWSATLSYRRYLNDLGLGIAEAMDTAQRGGGLNWAQARELINLTCTELPNENIYCGAGTDQLCLSTHTDLDAIVSAYIEQIEAIQVAGGRVILMSSRTLAKSASSSDDYLSVYRRVLSVCDQPVILHWLGEMFDPHLKGYWGSSNFEDALETALATISENADKIDGIKLSLLDKNKEIVMRRRLPNGVKMYTGDDFNYPELIAGDSEGYSHALLGIFDPIAPIAARAGNKLAQENRDGFFQEFNTTLQLSRLIFQHPTRHYKTGVVFLAWLNGFQKHFIMVAGAQSARSLGYFIDCFKMADQAGLLRDPDHSMARMKTLLNIYGY